MSARVIQHFYALVCVCEFSSWKGRSLGLSWTHQETKTGKDCPQDDSTGKDQCFQKPWYQLSFLPLAPLTMQFSVISLKLWLVPCEWSVTPGYQGSWCHIQPCRPVWESCIWSSVALVANARSEECPRCGHISCCGLPFWLWHSGPTAGDRWGSLIVETADHY